MLAGDLDRELDREPVGVVEPERVVGRDLVARPGDDVVQQLAAGLERAREALLLGGEELGDARLLAAELGMGVAEKLDHPRMEADEERVLEPDPAAEQHRPPDHAPQHVAAALVPRLDPVGSRGSSWPAHGRRAP